MFAHALSQYGWFPFCVRACVCVTCFSSCISSWLQVSPLLVILSDPTHKRMHALKHTHTHTRRNKRWRQYKHESGQSFTRLIFRYEPISLIRDSSHSTLSLFMAVFCPSFLMEKWDLDLVYIHVWPNLPIESVIRWRPV